MLKKVLSKNKLGFTLVELMAVVLIIGVLVAIAIPVYNNSSKSAKSKTCKANIRTIMSAVEQYNTTNATACTTMDQLTTDSAYLKSSPVCPVGTAYTIDSAANLTSHFGANTTIDDSSTHLGL